jgi:hypothetical protein
VFYTVDQLRAQAAKRDGLTERAVAGLQQLGDSHRDTEDDRRLRAALTHEVDAQRSSAGRLRHFAEVW